MDTPIKPYHVPGFRWVRRFSAAILIVSLLLITGVFGLITLAEMDVTVTGPGLIEPIRKTRIKSSIEGTIKSVLVSSGDQVTEGQVVAELDDTIILSQLNKADEDLESNRLRQDEYIHRRKRDLAFYEAERVQANARVEIASLQLEQVSREYYSNYIQLTCPSSYDFRALIKQRREKFDFYLHPDYYAVHPYAQMRPSPLLESFWVERDVIMADGRLLAFLNHAIDLGYCVQACVDEYHIPGMACYQEQHRTHEILISGYDLETQSFVVSIGFDRAGDYSVDEISFDEVERAIGSADLTGHYNQLGLGLLRPAKGITYDLDVAWIVEQLHDYLGARNTSQRFRGLRTPDDHLYGVAVYGWLKQYLEHLVDHHDCYDIRPIHILWEHKKVMADRVKYLASRGLVDESFSKELDQIVAEVAVMRMMMLKARATLDSGMVERVGERLGGVEGREAPVLRRLAEALNPISRHEMAVAGDRAIAVSLRQLA